MKPSMDVFFHREVHPPVDGTAAYLDGLLRSIAEDFSIILYVYSGERGIAEHVAPGGYRVCRVQRLGRPGNPATSRSPERSRIANALRGLDPRIYRVARRVRVADLLLGVDPFVSLPVGLLARAEGRRFVYRASDSVVALGEQMEGVEPPVGYLTRLYGRLFEGLLFRLSDRVLVPSRVLEAHLRSRGVPEDRVIYSPHGTDAERFTRDFTAARQRIRRDLGVPEEACLAIFVGNADWMPNRVAIEYILETLGPALRAASAPVHLLVVGSGTDRYASQGGGRTTVLGQVEDVPPYLAAADLGLAPMSIMGGASAKMVEYLVSGLTVVASPKAAETIPQEHGVYTAELADFPAQVARLAAALEDVRAERSEIHRRAAATFSWNRVVPPLRSVLGR